MALKSILFLGLFGSLALSRATSRQPVLCQVEAMSDELRVMATSAMANMTDFTAAAGETITVPTYFHVLAKGRSLEEGYLTKDMMRGQIKQLNADFAPTGFVFALEEINWTINADWAKNPGKQEVGRALRKGGYDSFNVYFADIEEGGFAFYPRRTARGSPDFFQDGARIGYPATFGGTGKVFNQGKATSHEAGHWLFLQHTFENGCNAPGDDVADTPFQERPILECDKPVKSCPNRNDLAPLFNHMGYGRDPCRSEFTPGQVDRMKRAWKVFREGK